MRTPTATESFLRHPTSMLLATPGSVRVLREVLSSDGPVAVSELAEASQLTTQTVRNALAGLQKGGVVEGLGQGRARLYRADVSHPLFLPLAALFRAEEERAVTVLTALRMAAGSVTPAPLGVWIYGSAARAEDLPDSDLEIALVAADDDVETPVDRLREILGPIQDVQRVWTSVIGLAPSDVRRLASGDRWWKSATRPHIPLYGKGPDELAELLQRPDRSRRTFGR